MARPFPLFLIGVDIDEAVSFSIEVAARLLILDDDLTLFAAESPLLSAVRGGVINCLTREADRGRRHGGFLRSRNRALEHPAS